VEDASGSVARRDLIHATLLQLPPRERAALVLREVEGFSNGEIFASAMNTPTARRYIHDFGAMPARPQRRGTLALV
jgi:DNA-directed RNA polymerase specialized sigma24 family protein